MKRAPRILLGISNFAALFSRRSTDPAARAVKPGRYSVRDLATLPTLVSLLRLPLGAAFVAVSDRPWLALAILSFAAVTDIVDGFLARRFGQATPTGAVVDGVLDKAFAAIVVAALVFQDHLEWLPALLLATREIGELPLVAWWAVHDGRRSARAEQPRANWLGKAATVVQFIAIATVLFQARTRYGWVAISAATGVAAAIVYWRRELRALASASGPSGAKVPTCVGTGLAPDRESDRDSLQEHCRTSTEGPMARRLASLPDPPRKELVMETFKRGYALKAAGMLLFMGGVAAALFLGPMLSKPERVTPVDLPAMTNIPPEGSLSIETE
jgi:phosphatidylglycerophosphate synthase